MAHRRERRHQPEDRRGPEHRRLNVPAGSYTLYTLPGANAWKLIINKQTGQWGTEYNQSQDLARVDMKVTQRSSPLEQFTISFDKSGGNSATLKLEWANTIASVEVKEKK